MFRKSRGFRGDQVVGIVVVVVFVGIPVVVVVVVGRDVRRRGRCVVTRVEAMGGAVVEQVGVVSLENRSVRGRARRG